MTKLGLTMQDVNRLSHDLSVENKAAAAQKISAYYDGTDISERGRKLAEDIFRIMVEDVQVKVREVLSESLKNCKSIPRDITVKLINDQDSVAVPFIKYYANLTKEDLISIIEAQSSNKQKAVAQRKNLPEDVSQYIVDKCSEDVVAFSSPMKAPISLKRPTIRLLINIPTATISKTPGLSFRPAGFGH